MKRTHTVIGEYLLSWCKGGCIAQSDIKEISIELADKLKKKKPAHVLFNPFNEMYQKYADIYQKDVIWSSRTGRSINEIIEKISLLVKKKNDNFKDEDVLNAWEMILQNLPEFYRNSFDIVAIANKLDSIINTIRSGKKSGINTSAAAEYLRSAREGA